MTIFCHPGPKSLKWAYLGKILSPGDGWCLIWEKNTFVINQSKIFQKNHILCPRGANDHIWAFWSAKSIKWAYLALKLSPGDGRLITHFKGNGPFNVITDIRMVGRRQIFKTLPPELGGAIGVCMSAQGKRKLENQRNKKSKCLCGFCCPNCIIALTFPPNFRKN